MQLTKFDTFGVKEYKLWVKICLAFTILYTYIGIAAYPLFLVEVGHGNIKTYADAFWVLQMSASTIGFGDFYPSTLTGRSIVAISFYIGVGLAGYAGSAIAGAFTSFTNKDTLNRELKHQNAQILKQLKQLTKEHQCTKQH